MIKRLGIFRIEALGLGECRKGIGVPYLRCPHQAQEELSFGRALREGQGLRQEFIGFGDLTRLVIENSEGNIDLGQFLIACQRLLVCGDRLRSLIELRINFAEAEVEQARQGLGAG